MKNTYLITKQDYRNSIQALISRLNQLELKDSILAVYIGGSVSREDYIPGRSDIDIYVVMKSYDMNIEKELNNIGLELTIKYLKNINETCGESFSFSFTTLNDIKNNKSWLGLGSEYHCFVKNALIIYGKDIKYHLKKPTDKEVCSYSNKAMNNLLNYIKHNPIPEINKNNLNSILRGVFGATFSAIHFLLSSKGYYIRGKVDMFNLLYDNNRIFDLSPEVLVSFIKFWNIYNEKDLLIPEAHECINNAKSIILEIKTSMNIIADYL